MDLRGSETNPTILAVVTHDFLGQIGVCIFFMITGYFMVSKEFKFTRISSVMSQVLAYTIPLFFVWILVSCLAGEFKSVSNLRNIIIMNI